MPLSLTRSPQATGTETEGAAAELRFLDILLLTALKLLPMGAPQLPQLLLPLPLPLLLLPLLLLLLRLRPEANPHPLSLLPATAPGAGAPFDMVKFWRLLPPKHQTDSACLPHATCHTLPTATCCLPCATRDSLVI